MTRGDGEVPQGIVYTVRGDVAGVRPVVEEFFVGHGWRPRERGAGRVDYEIGSRRRTILLGGLAGRKSFLTAQISLVDGGDADSTEVRYRWGAGAGQALGGSLGRARAARTHLETAGDLERALGRDGRLLDVRRI